MTFRRPRNFDGSMTRTSGSDFGGLFVFISRPSGAPSNHSTFHRASSNVGRVMSRHGAARGEAFPSIGPSVYFAGTTVYLKMTLWVRRPPIRWPLATAWLPGSVGANVTGPLLL